MLASKRPRSKDLPLVADGIVYARSKASRVAQSTYFKAEEEEEEEEQYYNGNENLEAGNCSPVSVVHLLKECAKRRDLRRGSGIHAQFITRSLLAKDVFVSSTLVHMYAKCGALSKAQEVFNELPSRNTVAWNSLIAGYVQHGHEEEAIDCFQRMRRQGFSPDGITFTFILKACGISGAIDKGQKLHAEVVRDGLLNQENFVGTALVDMYVKCDMLEKAQEVFDELTVRNVVSWTALIAGYAQQGYSREALTCFEQMQLGGVFPNAVTFVCVLKACGNLGDSKKGQDLHAQIVDEGLLSKNIVLGTALVDMYFKCGLLAKAQEVFDQLSDCNVVTWNALIVGYAQHGLGQEALSCFYRMRSQGVPANVVTFLCILKACVSIGRAEDVEEVHAILQRDGYMLKDIILANALLNTYAKCGLLVKARKVFDGIGMPNVVSWNTLIAGYVQNGDGEEAVTCFERMQQEGMCPDAVTYASILKACGGIEETERGQRIYAQIAGNRLMIKDAVVGSALVDMYAKCGALGRAEEVFDRIAVRNLVSWTALIGGYAQHGHTEEALNRCHQMQHEDVSPDAVTFSCILRACDNKDMADKGIEIHTQIVKDGYLEKDLRVGTALIDMYAKSGMLLEARDVFDELPAHDVVTWTVLIAGYAQSGHGKDAIHLFEQMQARCFCPDAPIYASIFKACGSIGAVGKGLVIHGQIVRDGLFEQDVVVGTALVDMYVKCGMLAEAQVVFDKLPSWNVVSWNAVLNGYAQLANNEGVLDCFQRMQSARASPDLVTFMGVARVCGNLGAACRGQELHGEMVKKGLLENDLVTGNAVLDMYLNCCMLDEADNVFQKLQWDLVSWNALIAGYAQLASFETALAILKRMLKEELDPDTVTFTLVLNTCNHGGLLDEGQMMFEIMRTCYYITPNVEHYTIMVDLFGRAGNLDRVEALIKEMPVSLSLTVWLTLLGACQKWGNLKIGQWAYDHVVELDELHAAAYVTMGNMYARWLPPLSHYI